MALLSFEEETARAEPGAAFVDEDAFDAWMQIWCEECNREDCPLIVVAEVNRTPQPWQLRDAGAVNKYTCTEFVKTNADDRTVVIESD